LAIRFCLTVLEWQSTLYRQVDAGNCPTCILVAESREITGGSKN
jgi:hypothetical protein